jgi:hypothetical protein
VCNSRAQDAAAALPRYMHAMCDPDLLAGQGAADPKQYCKHEQKMYLPQNYTLLLSCLTSL